MTVDELYRLPIRTFWLLESSVSRLRAEENIRQVRVIAATQDKTAAEEVMRGLAAELGSIVVQAPVRDEQGFNRLKQLAKR